MNSMRRARQIPDRPVFIFFVYSGSFLRFLGHAFRREFLDTCRIEEGSP